MSSKWDLLSCIGYRRPKWTFGCSEDVSAYPPVVVFKMRILLTMYSLVIVAEGKWKLRIIIFFVFMIDVRTWAIHRNRPIIKVGNLVWWHRVFILYLEIKFIRI